MAPESVDGRCNGMGRQAPRLALAEGQPWALPVRRCGTRPSTSSPDVVTRRSGGVGVHPPHRRPSSRLVAAPAAGRPSRLRSRSRGVATPTATGPSSFAPSNGALVAGLRWGAHDHCRGDAPCVRARPGAARHGRADRRGTRRRALQLRRCGSRRQLRSTWSAHAPKGASSCRLSLGVSLGNDAADAARRGRHTRRTPG